MFTKLNSSLCTLHHFADGQKLKKNSLKFAFYRSYICTISSKLIDLTRSNITLIYSNLLLISGTCFIVAICFVFDIKVIIARRTRKRQQKTHFSKNDQTQFVFIVQISWQPDWSHIRKLISSKYTTRARKLLLFIHTSKVLLICCLHVVLHIAPPFIFLLNLQRLSVRNITGEQC